MTQGISREDREVLNSLACPHCGAGSARDTVGLFWDRLEGSWRCILCGHRTFDRRHMTYAEMIDEALWDRILEVLDQESAKPEDRREKHLEAV